MKFWRRLAALAVFKSFLLCLWILPMVSGGPPPYIWWCLLHRSQGGSASITLIPRVITTKRFVSETMISPSDAKFPEKTGHTQVTSHQWCPRYSAQFLNDTKKGIMIHDEFLFTKISTVYWNYNASVIKCHWKNVNVNEIRRKGARLRKLENFKKYFMT